MMENLKKVTVQTMIVAAFAIAAFSCDCADDGELRRLEQEKQIQTHMDSLR